MIAYPPTAREILSRPWSYRMSKPADFLLIQRPAAIDPKAVAFASLDALAQAIHDRRGERELRLLNAAMPFANEAKARKGVAVWAVGSDDESTEYVGWAWLDGGDFRKLAAALEALQPQQARHREAA